MIGPFPLDLLPGSLFLVFLPFYYLSLGILPVPQPLPYPGAPLAEGRKEGATGMEVGPGITGTLSYSGAPPRIMDIYPE